MKAYKVEQKHYDYYTGTYTETKIVGYYTNKATAEKVATEHKADAYHTVGDATVEEITVNED